MATEKLQVFKCEVCGIVAEVLDGGGGELVCCGLAMQLLAENATDAAREKHVPVVEKSGAGIKVKVGSVAHPMEQKHYIQWIEVVSGERACRQFLRPGQAPEAEFDTQAEDVIARGCCNLHGLWKA